MSFRTSRRPASTRRRRWRAAIVGAAAVAFGSTGVAAASPSSHLLAPPPAGITIGPSVCASKTLHEKLEGWVCKTDYASFGFSPTRLQVSGGFKNAHSKKKYYLNSLTLQSEGEVLDRCEIYAWISPGASVECAANASVPSNAKVQGVFVFEGGNEGWPSSVTIEI